MPEKKNTTEKNQAKTPEKKAVLTARMKAELFPQNIRYFSLVWVVYIIVLIFLIYFGFTFYSFTQIKAKDFSDQKITIDKSYIKKLNDLKDYGTPATTDTGGFGRTNPFEAF